MRTNAFRSGWTYLYFPLLLMLFTGVMVISISQTVYAMLANPAEFEIEQPDGTKFKARLYGDEFQHWVEAVASGHTILKNENDGFWEYADKRPDGKLKASGFRVDPLGLNIPSFIPKGLRPPRDADKVRRHNKLLQDIYKQRLKPKKKDRSDNSGPSSTIGNDTTLSDGSYFAAASATGDWVPSPISGNRNVVVILINFSNRALITTAADWHNTFFSTAPGAKSMANYYHDNSLGNVTITPIPHNQAGNPDGIITVTIADAHPNCGNVEEDDYDTEVTILNHALAQATNHVDFWIYDTNNNGLLETSELSFYFIYAGFEASDTTNQPNIWAHAWSGVLTAEHRFIPPYTVNDLQFGHWALSGELNGLGLHGRQLPIGTATHELGHSLCGLPDLYDTTKPSSINAGLGNFSLMAGGSLGYVDPEDAGTTPVALDAWSREFLGWARILSPKRGESYYTGLLWSLSPTGNNAFKLVNSSVSTTEYWLAENRYATGWDLGLRGRFRDPGWNGGLLILHVDNSVGTPGSNDINKYIDGGHQGVMAEQASTASCNMVATNCWGTANTLYYNGNNGTFDAGSAPNSRYYSGGESYLVIRDVSTAGSMMSMLVGFLPVDLYVSAVSSGSQQIENGDTVEVGGGVTNKGLDQAGQFNVGIYLSPDPAITTADTKIDELTVYSLPAGGLAGFYLYPTIKVNSLGAYYIGAIADYDNAVLEADESNNVRLGNQITVIDTIAPTGSITIDNGAANAGSLNVVLSLTCSDASGCSQMQFSNDNVTWSTMSYATTANWTLSSGNGTKTVYAKFMDGAGRWSTAYSDTIILSLPDLIVTAVSASPLSTSAGMPLTITGKVKNQGTAPAGYFRVRAYLSPDPVITTADVALGVPSGIEIDSLAAGSETTLGTYQTNINIAVEGTYYIGAIADSSSNIAESNEANNSLAGNQVNITCANFPVRIGGTNYTSLQDAYNAASSGAVIQSRDVTLTGDLNANRAISVTLDGGYNCFYSSKTGSTGVQGMITTSNGTTTIMDFILQ